MNTFLIYRVSHALFINETFRLNGMMFAFALIMSGGGIMSKINKSIKDQASDLGRFSQTKPVKVIAVTAGKGGVGKSNVSVNLAIALAELNQSVMLLDADLGLANVDIMLGLHTKYNLSHVMQGICHLSDIILQGPGGV